MSYRRHVVPKTDRYMAETMAPELHYLAWEDDVHTRKCMHCEKPLSLLKRMWGACFCCDTHRLEYEARMRELQLQRLALAVSGRAEISIVSHEPAYR